jgi:hypothetical protein
MKPEWKRFVLGILSPMLGAILLFAGIVFGLILPALETSTIERKKEMIRELTVSAWGILGECEQQARAGKLDPEAARQLAVDQIRHLRYGPGAKEYFWITDTFPRMIMHPYRPDLEGQDLSDYQDSDGTRLFVDFVQIAREKSEGYSSYRWQVHDEASHIAPKLSFVKLFAPWGWIIGTGLYVDDVRAETRRQTARLAGLGLCIFALAAILLLVQTRQSYRIERERQAAEEHLRDSEQRYRLLVEAAGEGMMVACAGRIVFMNRPLRALLQLPDEAAEPPALSDVFEPGFVSGGDSPPDRGPISTRLKNAQGEWMLVSVNVGKLPGSESDRLFIIRDLRPENSRERPGAAGSAYASPGLQDLLKVIREARSPQEIKSARQRLTGLVADGWKQGLHGSLLTRQITDVSDAAIAACIQSTLNELGSSPVPFAFLAFGSEGRREASMITDQDNGLVYADPDLQQAEAVSDYFARFAGRVCDKLVEAGFPPCNGALMASNPDWRMSASQWNASVKKWSAVGTPEALKGIQVTADHRCVFGDEKLCGILREGLHAASKGSQAFYFNLAKAALGYRPPVDSLGKWVPGHGTATLNIKDAVTPIVNLARIYALRHGLALISTPARLQALAEQGGLPEHEVRSLITGFEFLLRLRLQRHLEIADAAAPVDDSIRLSGLSELDHSILRHVLELTDRMQNHLRMDFCNMQV